MLTQIDVIGISEHKIQKVNEKPSVNINPMLLGLWLPPYIIRGGVNLSTP